MAPLSIARRLQLPRRLLVILEGEGLANDATALILYRFAVAAVSVGVFSLGQAVGTFAAIVVGEIVWGIGVGWLMLRLRRWVRDPRIEITLSILTPFLAYWPPEHLGGSGVLATVTAGLYISWNGLRLISAATRLQGIFFWDFLIYLIEGMVFLITGLQARTLVSRHHGLFRSGAWRCGATVVSAVVIVAASSGCIPRPICRAGWFRRSAATIRRRPGNGRSCWRSPASAASSRSPRRSRFRFTTADGSPFPERDLILFLTFVVILVTLVGQGLTLPLVARALGLAHTGRRERADERNEEFRARMRAIEAAIERLDELETERKLPKSVIDPIRAFQRDQLEHAAYRTDGDGRHRKLAELSDEIQLSLIEAERDAINSLYRDGKLKDESRRRIERELDLRDADLANQRAGA